MLEKNYNPQDFEEQIYKKWETEGDFKAEKDKKCFVVDLIEKVPTRFVSFVIKKSAAHSNAVHLIKQEISKNFLN